MEDYAIIELYFGRKERAIAETDRKYGRLCRHIAERVLSDVHEAEECVNDTYHELWRAIPPERPRFFRAFVAKIARNLAIDRLRKSLSSKRRSEALLSLDELEEVIPDKEHFSLIEDREVGEWISEFLRGQKEETRNIFLRKYWFFDSVSEIALRFGISEEKVKSSLFHTRGRLRAFLEEKGVRV